MFPPPESPGKQKYFTSEPTENGALPSLVALGTRTGSEQVPERTVSNSELQTVINRVFFSSQNVQHSS